MRRLSEKHQNRIAAIAAAAFFALAAAAVHDMQHAEGVGLFFALRAGKERLFFDIAVDITAAAGLLLLITLPCVLTGRRRAVSLLRLELAFLSFMPALSLAYLLRPFQAETEPSLRPLLFLLQTLLPFLVLLAGALRTVTKRSVGKRRYLIFCVSAALLQALSLAVPTLGQLADFLSAYLLLLVCFDLWERLFSVSAALGTWSWLLFGGLAFRAFYVLSEVMRRY